MLPSIYVVHLNKGLIWKFAVMINRYTLTILPVLCSALLVNLCSPALGRGQSHSHTCICTGHTCAWTLHRFPANTRGSWFWYCTAQQRERQVTALMVERKSQQPMDPHVEESACLIPKEWQQWDKELKTVFLSSLWISKPIRCGRQSSHLSAATGRS